MENNAYRYVLIDTLHIAHKCVVAKPLTTTISVNGKPQVVDTTIPSIMIKSMFSYGGRGLFNTGIFLEGGNTFRKNYFSKDKNGKETEIGAGYKAGRAEMGNFFTGVNLSTQILMAGGCSLYRVPNYEADDTIYNMVLAIKAVDKTTPIDIITNDSDLLPLVDDQVSVYMRGKRQYAVDGSPEHKLYYQVTPSTFEEFLSYSSKYAKFNIPYNSLLLHKLIRGDEADNVSKGVDKCGPKKYNEIMANMQVAGVDFPNVFRYGNDFNAVMRPILLEYFTEDEVSNMEYIYNGIGLRKFPEGTQIALPAKMNKLNMQVELSKYSINLK